MLAIYPGSFDPITNGHLDIIRRSAKFSDKLVVAVLNNTMKKPMFSMNERIWMLNEVTGDLPNVEIDSFSGLLADYARSRGANLIIRGLRAVTDFEYEFQMALTNRMLDKDLETLFISTSMEYLYLGSSIVKEIALHGGDISDMTPVCVQEMIKQKINENKRSQSSI